MEVEPEAMRGTDVDEHTALVAIALAIHQRMADHARPVANRSRGGHRSTVGGNAAAEAVRQVSGAGAIGEHLEDLLLDPDPAIDGAVEERHPGGAQPAADQGILYFT